MSQILIVIGSCHHVLEMGPEGPKLGAYPLAGQSVLQSAYDSGQWEPYTEAESPTSEEEPNWSEFRLSLMVEKSFRAWAVSLPADWREDLKLAALAANPEALQNVYNYLVSVYPPPAAAAAVWADLAAQHHIPVIFQWEQP